MFESAEIGHHIRTEDRTSTDVAPWHVVASDDKLFARVEVLTHVCERLERALDLRS